MRTAERDFLWLKITRFQTNPTIISISDSLILEQSAKSLREDRQCFHHTTKHYTKDKVLIWPKETEDRSEASPVFCPEEGKRTPALGKLVIVRRLGYEGNTMWHPESGAGIPSFVLGIEGPIGVVDSGAHAGHFVL